MLEHEEFLMSMEKSARLRVLVVDDEALIRWAMGETLAHAGCEVSEAGSAAETLHRLRAGSVPDVIILDLRLPDSSDLTLLATIRQLVPQSRVVMMTAFGTAAMQEDALELGAYAVVNKPLEMRDVYPLVRRAFTSPAAPPG